MRCANDVRCVWMFQVLMTEELKLASNVIDVFGVFSLSHVNSEIAIPRDAVGLVIDVR
jgi:hypothetical protein